MAADIFISVNGRQVAEAQLELLIPASEGKCAPGDLSDWCKGKCGTTGKFTCKALVNNGGFDCGCSVLKIVESEPIPVKPGDYLSATLNTDRSITPESQKRDDRLEAIIVETRVVSMVGVPATGSQLLRVAMDTTTADELKKLDMRSIRIDNSLSLTDFHYGPRSVLLEFNINTVHFTPQRAGAAGRGLALSGNTMEGTHFIGVIHIEPIFTAAIEGDEGVCDCNNTGCNCGEDPSAGDKCTDEFIGEEHEGNVKCFFGKCYCLTHAPPEPAGR
jgi:hypothetical protein